MALQPGASKSVQLEETQKSIESSYTLLSKNTINQNNKVFETPPPTTTRSSSIGSALSRLVKRGISRGKSPLEMCENSQRPASADSPLSPQDKTPK